jgi:RNA polymerase sigma factor (sigma-70 family)
MTPKSLIAPARLARRPVLATQTDSRLVDLVRAGYEPAFEAIVSRYRGALLRYAERFLSRERAEDVVQQSFVRAYEAMLRDDAELNLRPWLYRIAHNTSLNTLRDRGLRHEALDETIDGVERPDQALERSQGLRDVVAAVQALPDRQRDAIVLRELEGRTYQEIATELGVSDGSVRQLLNRARNTLRAGATALIPLDLVLRIPLAAQSEPLAARVAELCGAAGAGAALSKVGATAAVTATLVGGAVVVPDRIQTDTNAPPASASERDRADRAGAPEPTPRESAVREESRPTRVVLEPSRSSKRDDDGSRDKSAGGGGDDGNDGGGDERSTRGPGGGGGDDDGGRRRRGKSQHGNSGRGGGGEENEHDEGEDEDEDEAEDDAAKLVRDDSHEEGDNSGPGGGDRSESGSGEEGSGSGGGGEDSQDAGEARYEGSGESGGSDGSGESGDSSGSGS